METNFFATDATIFLVSSVNSHSRVSKRPTRLRGKRKGCFLLASVVRGEASRNEPFPNAPEICPDLALYHGRFVLFRLDFQSKDTQSVKNTERSLKLNYENFRQVVPGSLFNVIICSQTRANFATWMMHVAKNYG